MEIKKLIAALRYCADNEKQDGCDKCPYLPNGMCHTMLSDAAYALEEAEKLIEELEAKMPKWISVKDRLPKPRFAREWYLVALESGCVKSLAFDRDRNEWWETGSPVTHWMPLPDAPEVEG